MRVNKENPNKLIKTLTMVKLNIIRMFQGTNRAIIIIIILRSLKRIERNNKILRNLRKLRFMLENPILNNKRIPLLCSSTSNRKLHQNQMKSTKYLNSLINSLRMQPKIIEIRIDRNSKIPLETQKRDKHLPLLLLLV